MRLFRAMALLGLASFSLWAQPAREIPTFRPDWSPGDPERGAELLARAQSQRFPDDVVVHFTLRERASRDVLREGQLWGRPTLDGGSLLRLIVLHADGEASDQWILRTGASGQQVWRVGETSRREDPSAFPVRERLIDDLPLRVFHILTPFLYWNDYTYEGIDRSRGRGVHLFYFTTPEDYTEAWPELSAVRLALDGEFAAPVRLEMISPARDTFEELRIISFKRFQETWLVKALEARDTASRDRIRLILTHAAIGPDLPAEAFAPEVAQQPLPQNLLESLR